MGEAVKAAAALWSEHGTKLLGYAQAILAGWLLIPDLFPPEGIKYAQAAGVVLGVLTVRRGHVNSAKLAEGTDEQSGV